MSHPPPSGAPQTGPAWGRLCSQPRHSGSAPSTAHRGSSEHHAHVEGTRGMSPTTLIGGHRAEPAPDGAHSSGVKTPVAAAAEQAGAVCRRSAAPPGSTPPFHLRARKPAAAKGNRSSAAKPQHRAPERGVPRKHTTVLLLGHTVPGGYHPPPPPLRSPRVLSHRRSPHDVLLAVPSCEELPSLADTEECKQSRQRRRDSCCRRGRSPPCSCPAAAGSWAPRTPPAVGS